MDKTTGAIKDIYDSRDFQFGEVAKYSAPFDWATGYDVEEKLGLKIPVKNQFQSSSCGGQAWSYYGEVLEALKDKTFEERSAKFIYAQTAVPGGGSRGRDNCDVLIKQGTATEKILPSYLPDGTTTEEFITKAEDITAEVRADAAKERALVYANVAPNIDLFAQAIRDNGGLVLGIDGQNNGTWLSAFPKPPQTTEWAHWLYAGKAKMIDGKKHIGVLNSWGDAVGESGWQWISEEYFTTGHIWYAWTLIFEDNQPDIKKPSFEFTQFLRYGSRGYEVEMLQLCLKWLKFFPATQTTTRYFGLKTLAAVKKYQSSKGLLADGIVGKNTRKALNEDF